MYLILVVSLLLVQVYGADECTTPNNELGECILLSSCTELYEALQTKHEMSLEEFVEKSICGGTKFIPKVCCGPASNFTVVKTRLSTSNQYASNMKKGLLPDRNHCGYQHSDDYLRVGNDKSVRINEFPWLARIIHASDSNGSGAFFECAGSLINIRYVLTSAYCVDENLYPVVGVRLGEFHTKNQTDCILEQPYEQECSNFEDFGIDKVIRHPNYTDINYSNDVALLRLNSTVVYSDYIRPICLPSSGSRYPKPGEILTTSGWGYYHKLVESKKRILGKIITKEECINSLNMSNHSRITRTITENSICTLQQGNHSEETCNSDLGGPVMFSHRSQWHQEAVVAFSVNCLRTGVPEVHTSLITYLEWIEESLEA